MGAEPPECLRVQAVRPLYPAGEGGWGAWGRAGALWLVAQFPAPLAGRPGAAVVSGRPPVLTCRAPSSPSLAPYPPFHWIGWFVLWLLRLA
ncbi:hypothetical protein QFZ63_001828 [Streptomyces sp. B3I7]|nr:hypothetical protein [Streptomyces sp. B3I7]